MNHDISETDANVVNADFTARFSFRDEVREAEKEISQAKYSRIIERLNVVLEVWFVRLVQLEVDGESKRDEIDGKKL